MDDWIIGYGDTYMPLISLIVFLFVRKNIRPEEYCFIYYLWISVILFLIINIIPLFGFKNLFLYYFDYVFELTFVAYYITKQLLNIKPLFYIITGGYFLFLLIDIFMWEGLDEFGSYAAAVQKIIVSFLCMYYILTLAKTDDLLRFQKLPGFWITTGFLLSAAISIFTAVTYKYYIEYKVFDMSTWLFESIGTILKFIFIITGFLCYKRSSRLPYQSPTSL